MCCVYDGLEPHNHYEPQQDTNNPISSNGMCVCVCVCVTVVLQLFSMAVKHVLIFEEENYH
jgi:hypothetical protein